MYIFDTVTLLLGLHVSVCLSVCLSVWMTWDVTSDAPLRTSSSWRYINGRIHSSVLRMCLGVCQKQHKKLLVVVQQAWDLGIYVLPALSLFVCLSVCLSVTLRYFAHIGCVILKLTAQSSAIRSKGNILKFRVEWRVWRDCFQQRTCNVISETDWRASRLLFISNRKLHLCFKFVPKWM